MTQTNASSKKQEIMAEVFNAITHGTAALLSLVALVLLVMKGLEKASPTTVNVTTSFKTHK